MQGEGSLATFTLQSTHCVFPSVSSSCFSLLCPSTHGWHVALFTEVSVGDRKRRPYEGWASCPGDAAPRACRWTLRLFCAAGDCAPTPAGSLSPLLFSPGYDGYGPIRLLPYFCLPFGVWPVGTSMSTQVGRRVKSGPCGWL